eukprot:XP_014061224.1 PREDICTED: otoferlin-like isoform X2 [Salmo salar]
MNGYMVLTNWGSQSRPCSPYSRTPPRTLSRPAGDVTVNMDADPSVRKMDTVVKLDANEEKEEKKRKRKKKNGEAEEDDETDESMLDWWSKYFASIETLMEILRAQEAALAEAEEREDQEIAAEGAGKHCWC